MDFGMSSASMHGMNHGKRIYNVSGCLLIKAYRSLGDFAAKIANGDIAWATQNNSATRKYNLAGFVLFVTNDGAGEWRMIHD